MANELSRRKLIKTGLAATAGALGLGVAARLAQKYGLVPPDHGGIYGLGETLTYAAQRLLTLALFSACVNSRRVRFQSLHSQTKWSLSRASSSAFRPESSLTGGFRSTAWWRGPAHFLWISLRATRVRTRSRCCNVKRDGHISPSGWECRCPTFWMLRALFLRLNTWPISHLNPTRCGKRRYGRTHYTHKRF